MLRPLDFITCWLASACWSIVPEAYEPRLIRYLPTLIEPIRINQGVWCLFHYLHTSTLPAIYNSSLNHYSNVIFQVSFVHLRLQHAHF